MIYLNRAWLNITKKPGKSGVLALLVFLLGTILAGAISISRAIGSMEESLFLRMPAVSTLFLDAERTAREAEVFQWDLGPEFWNAPQPTQEEISRIGELPYVRSYDMVMIPSMMSRDLEWVVPPIDEERLPGAFTADHFESELSGMRRWGGAMETLGGRGVTNPELTDIESGLIELVAGRTFTQEEIDTGASKAVVSRLFAEENQLQVGATFMVENIAHNVAAMSRAGYGNFTVVWDDERFMEAHQEVELEIIGIFDVAREFMYENYQSSFELSQALSRNTHLHNRIYVPIGLANEMIRFVNDGMQRILDELIEAFPADGALMVQEEPRVEAVFVLYDPRDLERFATAATDLLPGYWGIADLRGVDSAVTASMDTMLSIADMILWVTVGATIIILSLLITLFLRDRRHEIGIYLAVGERKWKVLVQLLVEVLTVSMVAVVLALFVGNSLSGVVSQNLLEQSLIAEQEGANVEMMVSDNLALLNPGELTMEELALLYDTSLDKATLAIILGASSGILILSTLLPMSYVLKLNPKEILM